MAAEFNAVPYAFVEFAIGLALERQHGRALHLEQLKRTRHFSQLRRCQAATPDAAGVQGQGVVSQTASTLRVSYQGGPVSECDGRGGAQPTRHVEPRLKTPGCAAGTFTTGELHDAFVGTKAKAR